MEPLKCTNSWANKPNRATEPIVTIDNVVKKITFAHFGKNVVVSFFICDLFFVVTLNF